MTDRGADPAPTDPVERYRAILAAIGSAAVAAGRDPASVKLVAVSKTHPYESVRALYRAGHRDFGENYVQELVAKAERARADGLDGIRWHFIGHLQTNKIKTLLPHVALVHGVGSERVAAEIEKRADGRKIPVLIEVNVDGEESKSGVRIPEIRKLAEAIGARPGLELRGLMAIPDPARAGGARAAFRRVAALEADLRPLTRGELSMGMTADFADAIAEGATYVRVGTAIFGARSPRE